MKADTTLKDLDGITITVKIAPTLRSRMWLGLAVMKLGARIMGVALKIEDL